MDTPLPAAFVPPARADFPDWLSPMLVKELRQGVRTRVFVTLFIVLQVLMLLDVSLSLLVAAHGEDASAGGAFFWVMVGVPVLLVLPLSALNAISGEIKANTLELIFLTRLTARRIVVGKWLAVFAQSLLLVCAVLPYLVLRYFIGGVNLSNELVSLASMLGGSALLTAFATGFSAYPTRVVRPLAALFAIVFLFGGINVVVTYLFDGPVVAGLGPSLVEIAGLVLCGAVVLGLTLEVGAAHVAPPAENHSAVVRLLALAALVVALAAGLLTRRSLAVTTTAFVVAAAVCTAAVCERPRWIPSLFRPFATRGWVGRVLGRLFYPGWYTGVPFTLVVFGAFGALFGYQKALGSLGRIALFVASVGVLLFPVALIRTCFPKTKRATALFFAVQGLCALVTIFCAICDNTLKTSFRELITFLPLSTLLLAVSGGGPEADGRLTAVSVTTFISLLVLLVTLRRPMRQARAAERECLQMPTPTPDAPLA